ncbi:FxLYD domain-containing protein [Candidatus Bipolaricaulota bacterium]|nr:FxLYD domain-containing protein [Candidatus Bipolaricaulota bacterium]
MKRAECACLIITYLLSFWVLGRAEADIDVVSWTWYRSDLGYYQVLGEAENAGDSNAAYVMFTATWYSGDGSVVGTDFSFSFLDIVCPGEKTPFLITLLNENVVAEKVRLQWTWDNTRQHPYRDVSVRDIHASYDSDLECLEVIGEVENTGSSSAQYVMIIITCYDAEGEVVAADFTFTTLDTVAAGGTSPFKTYVCDRAREIKTYSWIVQHD